MKNIYVFIFALCASVVWATEDAQNGKFTIDSKGNMVQFAPGNLQYIPSSDTWQFAASQTEIVGKDAAYVSANPGYTGVIDLFAWDTDYSNGIGEGWRMLTQEEWEYLLREEEIGYGPSFAGQATVGTQHGLMLLPDGWNEFGELKFSASPNNWTTNNYTTANWSELEKSGVVFLPCTDNMGSYWSSSFPNDESKAYSTYFSETGMAADYPAIRSCSYAVRLVRDIKETPTGVENVEKDEVQCTKVLRDGQLYLMYKGTMYNVLGQTQF